MCKNQHGEKKKEKRMVGGTKNGNKIGTNIVIKSERDIKEMKKGRKKVNKWVGDRERVKRKKIVE